MKSLHYPFFQQYYRQGTGYRSRNRKYYPGPAQDRALPWMLSRWLKNPEKCVRTDDMKYLPGKFPAGNVVVPDLQDKKQSSSLKSSVFANGEKGIVQLCIMIRFRE